MHILQLLTLFSLALGCAQAQTVWNYKLHGDDWTDKCAKGHQ